MPQPWARIGLLVLLEQFGGANGELAAAMQYSIQGMNCEDAARKDLLMDIGTEELSHLEVVGALIRMHLKPMKQEREAAEADPLVAIAGGGGVALFDSMGNAWTSDYLKVTGDLAVDLRSNIAAEARAKIVYERLISFTQDEGSKQALQFMMTREITHINRVREKNRRRVGSIPTREARTSLSRIRAQGNQRQPNQEKTSKGGRWNPQGRGRADSRVMVPIWRGPRCSRELSSSSPRMNQPTLRVTSPPLLPRGGRAGCSMQ